MWCAAYQIGDEGAQGDSAGDGCPGEEDLLVGPQLLPPHGLQVLYQPPHPLLLRLCRPARTLQP